MFKFIQPERAKCSTRLMRNSAKCSMQLIRFSRYLIEEFSELSVLYHENFAFKNKGSTRIQRKHAKNAFFAIKSMHFGPFSGYFRAFLPCFCAFLGPEKQGSGGRERGVTRRRAACCFEASASPRPCGTRSSSGGWLDPGVAYVASGDVLRPWAIFGRPLRGLRTGIIREQGI